MASVETPEQVIQRFAAILDDVGIPYMLTGSFASGFHGSPRATQDIDLVIAPTWVHCNASSLLFPVIDTTSAAMLPSMHTVASRCSTSSIRIPGGRST
jgi:hypothetical protein